MSDAKQQVEDYFRGYNDTVNSGDLEAFLRTQASDVAWNPPDRAAVVGLDNLRQYLVDEWFGVYSMELSNTVEEALPIGDEYIYSRGTWSIDLTPKDGSAPTSLHGTFSRLFRNENGELKGARSAFSILD